MKSSKKYCLVIRIKKNDSVKGKLIRLSILEIIKEAKISGATLWTGMGGYGKRGKSDIQIEGITINMPLIIEVVDELEKIEPILPQIKNVVGDNGLITLNEVNVI
jgi:PII-like signaling protein